MERGFWMLLESGGSWISPHLLDHPKTQWKTKNFFFDFLKVHNKLGKVTKFWTSEPLFSWRNSDLKKVQADSAPPHPNRVKPPKAQNIQKPYSPLTNSFFWGVIIIFAQIWPIWAFKAINSVWWLCAILTKFKPPKDPKMAKKPYCHLPQKFFGAQYYFYAPICPF